MIPEQAAVIDAGGGIALESAVALVCGSTTGVVVCHPHPLYGGDMHNPVVVRVAEVCRAAGMATLRFNFRGVGASAGRHGEGQAEQDDVRGALGHLGGRLGPGARVALAGYSFGAAVAAAVAAGGQALAGLALIAPPLAVPGFERFRTLGAAHGPLLVVAGADDPYCPRAALDRLAAALPDATVTVVEGADHFFLGKLYPLGEAVAAWARRVVGGGA